MNPYRKHIEKRPFQWSASERPSMISGARNVDSVFGSRHFEESCRRRPATDAKGIGTSDCKTRMASEIRPTTADAGEASNVREIQNKCDNGAETITAAKMRSVTGGSRTTEQEIVYASVGLNETRTYEKQLLFIRFN